MARRRSPEEFFEVFGRVQDDKKEAAERPDAGQAPEEGAGPGDPPSADAAPAEGTGLLSGPPLTVSRMAVFLVGAAVVLFVLAGYLIGWQRGWRAYAAKWRAPGRQAEGTAQAPPAAAEAEFADDKIFTLSTLGSRPEDKENLLGEAEYLNSNERFRRLGLRALVYKDSKGKFRLCASGFLAMGEARRGQVRAEVRRLPGRSGKPEYSRAGFYAP